MKTKQITAAQLVPGMEIMHAGYPEFDRVTHVGFTSAGMHVRVELEDGREFYCRSNFRLEVVA